MVAKDDDLKVIELKILSNGNDEKKTAQEESVTIDEFDEDTEKLLSPTMPLQEAQFQRRVGLCEFLCAYFSLFLINKPTHSAIIVSTLLIGLAVTVNLTLENDKAQIFDLDDVIETDYSNVRSKYELSLGKIDHWCLTGGNQNCKCEDPTEAISKMKYKFWEQTHGKNTELIDTFLGKLETGVDVVFIGENIVESWAGRSIGMKTLAMEPVGKVFDSIFDKEDSGGKYNGLPLGVAGDTAPNVLWRIQNGELPSYLNPKIFWLLVGTNDLAIKQCSEEVVLLGILRVIEEIQSLRPDAMIVVNSILPMTDDKKGRVPDIGGGRGHGERILPRKKVEHDDDDGDDDADDEDEDADDDDEDDDADDEDEDDDADDEDDDEDDDADDDNSTEKVSEEEEVKEEQKIEKLINLRTISPDVIKKARDRIPTIQIRQPFKRIPVSMWPSVVAINKQLRRFCTKHKNIYFSDVYDIFVDRDEDVPMLKQEYYRSFYTGMPSEKGNKALLDAISKRLKRLLSKGRND